MEVILCGKVEFEVLLRCKIWVHTCINIVYIRAVEKKKLFCLLWVDTTVT